MLHAEHTTLGNSQGKLLSPSGSRAQTGTPSKVLFGTAGQLHTHLYLALWDSRAKFYGRSYFLNVYILTFI